MIIGTAGHIDHGKSALVEALTGHRMDPLAEEQRRGITIELHVAPYLLPGGVAGVVDVPGHEDLVRTMVAGAAGIDLVLLVVAADEGIMPQSREHLAVVEQLGIPAGIPVITKADLVDETWLGLVRQEIEQWLGTSPVRFGPPIAVSTRTGRGLQELRSAIAAAAAQVPPRPRDDLFRLPVDRAFSKAGVGTVVTGTAWSGSIAIGDEVCLLPAGRAGRVRSLERHGRPVTASEPASRTAVGIAGLGRDEVRRGDVLVRAGDPWQPATALDVRLTLLPLAPRPLAHRTRVRIHLGTAEILARVQAEAPIPPGRSGLARLVLEQPAVARGGDRFVLRSYSPVATIGGGLVLDPCPPARRPVWPVDLDWSEPAARLQALVTRRPSGIARSLLPVVLGLPPGSLATIVERAGLEAAGDRLVPADALDQAKAALRDALEAHHRDHPADAGLPLETLRNRIRRAPEVVEAGLQALIAGGEIRVEQGLARLADFSPRPAAGGAVLELALQALDADGLAARSVPELEAALGQTGLAEVLRLASREGRLVQVERDRFFTPRAIARFRSVLDELGAAGTITPAAVRDRLGLSRKFVIPLLEWADRSGLTLRRGEGRILLPRRQA